MRPLFLTIALGLGSLGLLCLTPQPSEAFGRRGCQGGFSGPAYYAPGPMAYAPPAYYSAPMYGRPYPYPGPMYGQPPYAPPYSPLQPTTAVSVGMYDDNFQPPTINVLPETTVRWVNYGKHTHTVTANDGRWDSGDIPPDGSYSATFQHPGTYYYHCHHHKGMAGTVVVGSGGGSGPSGY
jgi:hypothetical protein